MYLRHLDLPDDIPGLLSGIRDFISRMDYHEFLPSSDDELVEAVQRLLDLGVVEVLVVEHGTELVGGIGMLYAPSIWNTKILSAEELFLWVSSDAPSTTLLRLIRGARGQAHKHNCHLINFKSLTSSPEKLDKIYRSMGLRPTEISYMGLC